jgi:RNA polymerase sigma factor (sigma-70 family)
MLPLHWFYIKKKLISICLTSNEVNTTLEKLLSATADHELWKQFKAGNKQSYETLMQAHYRSLFAYGLKFSKDGEFVKDCIQDLFLELWKNRETIGNLSYVRSYLFKCLRNKIWRVLHQQRWHHQAEQLEDDYYFDVEFSIEHHLIREETLRDTATKFADLLNQLPKRQKEIIYLRFYQNLEIDEIVQVMEINSQSAYNLLHKAISSLREMPLAHIKP